MPLLCNNGKFLDAAEPLFTAANRGFRYGEGLFETMKWLHGHVLHFELHWERLQHGLKILHLQHAGLLPGKINEEIGTLCRQNACSEMARVRLAVYREEDGAAGYVLECEPLTAQYFQWQEQGWNLGLYEENSKPTGPLSNLKSANYLLYLLAAAQAKEAGLDECMVRNSAGYICDGSRTNVFVVRNDKIMTPALDQGCVAGVIRRYLIETGAALKLPIQESAVTEEDLLQADEVFLTNAIQGIRWVQQYKDRAYNCAYTQHLFERSLATIYR